MIITLVLLYSCIMTPAQVALIEEMDRATTITNLVVDCLFLLDMVIIFNTAIIDEEMNIISDRGVIASDYLAAWFWIDLVAILPFDLVIKSNGEAANLVRFIRIGRIVKILKLLKLVRLIKMQKQGSFSLLSWLSEIFAVNADFKWFTSFFAYFAMTTHVLACLWIIIAKIDPNSEMSWINDYADEKLNRIYMKSFYFIVTTITTVGYGDTSATTFFEQIVCSIIMFIGVIAFAMASGTLTNYISNIDK